MLNKWRKGGLVVPGQTLGILECSPAAYSAVAANEAEKAASINVVEVRAVGRYGRFFMSGTEAEVSTAMEAAVAALEVNRGPDGVISGVVGEADVLSAWRTGARTVAIAPGAVVTVLAREAAARLGVALQVGPLEEPARAATDGATAARRLLYRRHPGWVAPQPLRGRAPIRFGRVAIVGAGGVGPTPPTWRHPPG